MSRRLAAGREVLADLVLSRRYRTKITTVPDSERWRWGGAVATPQ